MKKRTLSLQLVYYLPDLAVAYLIYLFTKRDIPLYDPEFLAAVIFVLVLKIAFHFITYRVFFVSRITTLKKLISNFRQGKLIVPEIDFFGGGYLADLYTELADMGKYLNSLTVDQKGEIDKFKELYNNIVYSSSSYFIALNRRDEIIFLNKSFCSNFQYGAEELFGKKLTTVFINPKSLLDAVEVVKKTGEQQVLSQVRLLANNRFGIIADVKVLRVNLQGEFQIIIMLDDITSKCRKDYQISLISQITESIQRDDELDRVLYSILTAVTAGSGLGFNRAMLFLYDEEKEALCGKMAVGPDSVEEAVKIWGAVQGENVDLLTRMSVYRPNEDRSNSQFYLRVVSTQFSAISRNLLVRAMNSMKPVYIHDSWNDSDVEEDVRSLLEVSEFVVVPLVTGNRAIGVIVADNKYNHTPIWHDNVELLSIFAVQAALSIESFKRLDEVRSQMDKIQSRQDAIVESEKMAAVGRIAAHIAHEIRNPLVTMGGYARRIVQIMMKGGKNLDSVRSSAEVIRSEAERLEKILSNVMDFTRPSSYIKEYHSLNDVVTDTYNLLKNLFFERKINVELRLHPDIPLVKSDFNQMKQVVLNLLQNAMDASESGGTITVETDVAGGKIIVTVRDSGHGIDLENIPKLFQPFFTTKVSGVGLGLAVVKKIVSDHGGEIFPANRPEGGAEFRIELPIVE